MKLPVKSKGPLPALQQSWMEELLSGPIPHEPRATCSACPQVDPQFEELTFDARTKCCTYMPALYNFLAGRILEDDDPEVAKGRATVEARLDKGEAVTPLGLLATPEYVEEYADDSRFGRAWELRCPHYLREEGGLCGVWRHREGTCATWYCRHVRGAVAFDFWRRGLSPLLRAAEKSLARWCAEQAGASAVDWGRWAGQPRALFIETSRIVQAMTWKEIESIGGDEVREFAHDARRHHQALLGAPYQPANPKLAPFDLQSDDGARARIATYTPFDPLELPTALLRELHRFDGRPRARSMADIRSRGIALDEELMQKLADWRVVVEPGDGQFWEEG